MKSEDNSHLDALRQAEARVIKLERALESLYSQTGKSLLQQAEEAARQADGLTDQLILAKKGLAQLKSDILCPRCQTLNPRHYFYCGHCGGRLPYRKGMHHDTKRDH